MGLRHHSRTYLVFTIGMIAGFTLSLVLKMFSVDVTTRVSDDDFGHGNIYNYDMAFRAVRQSEREQVKQQPVQADNSDERVEVTVATEKLVPSVHDSDSKSISIAADNNISMEEQELPPEQLILPKVEHPQSLNEVLPSRHTVFIAVITSERNLLSQTYAVQSTWGGTYDNVTFFVGKHSDISRAPHFMTVVKLHEAEEVTTEHTRRTLLHHVVRYISNHLLQHFRWFLIIGDIAYVRTDQLEVLLNNYDDSYNIYLGRPNRHFDKKEEDTFYNANSHYCIFDTGIVLSRGLVRRLSPHLSDCISSESLLLSYEGDWEFGNCILKYLDVKCTQASETADMFFVDRTGQLFESPTLFSDTRMQTAITLAPVRFPKLMYRVHLLYEELAYNHSVLLQQRHEEEIKKSFPFVPARLRSNFKIASDKRSDTMRRGLPSHLLLQPKFVPHNKWEIHSWDYFNQTQLLQPFHNLPSTGLIGVDRQEARNVLTKGMYLINKNKAPSERYGFERLQNGYKRIDPNRGADYILDFVLNRQYAHDSKVHKRINLFRPFQDEFLIVPNEGSSDHTVNFIVPLSGLSYRLIEFMKTYEANVLETKEDATLTVVLSNSSGSDDVHRYIQQYQNNYPEAKIVILDIYGSFSRGVAIHKGVQLFGKHDLLFICDVDIDVKWNFLRRCRLNTVRGKQVYFPIFFKLYKMDFVHKYGRTNVTSTIMRQNGHWAHYSYGMVCIYSEDYLDTGGFDLTLQGWGEEDVSFLHQVIKAGKEVMRAPDPGLIHRWHPKHCSRDSITSDTVFEHCLRSKAENIADRIELANYYFEKEET